MEVSRGRHESSGHSSSSSTTTTTNSATANPTPPPNKNGHPPMGSPLPETRSEPANPCPTAFVQADASSFKQVVQMLTGSPKSDQTPPPPPQQQPAKPHHRSIPPIKTNPKKTGSGFKLYERRNSLKSLKINPLSSFPGQPGSLASPHHPQILSPSILDFPALVLSPVTPLAHDPFSRSPRPTYVGPNLDPEAEEKAIREKGFFLHPSPATTPRDAEPLLLPLFPLSSPRVPGSSCSD